jgi:hypothetical protein
LGNLGSNALRTPPHRKFWAPIRMLPSGCKAIGGPELASLLPMPQYNSTAAPMAAKKRLRHLRECFPRSAIAPGSEIGSQTRSTPVWGRLQIPTADNQGIPRLIELAWRATCGVCCLKGASKMRARMIMGYSALGLAIIGTTPASACYLGDCDTLGYYETTPVYRAYGYSAPAYGYTAPVYGYSAPTYGYAAPAYGYRAATYGYAAPGYGYPVATYGYTAPAYGYSTAVYGYSAPVYGYAYPRTYGRRYYAPVRYYAPARYYGPRSYYRARVTGYSMR